jgi:predicted RNA binding protein YcfA (HicA-like mRNA interferase family)
MAKLPTDLSGLEVRVALERIGFVFRRQKGSHMMLRRDQPCARVVVPDHK